MFEASSSSSAVQVVAISTATRWEASQPVHAQSCLTLCDRMVCSPRQATLSMEFSRQEYWSGLEVRSNQLKPQSQAGAECKHLCLSRELALHSYTLLQDLKPWPGSSMQGSQSKPRLGR